MKRVVAVVALAAGLAACGAVDTVVDGFKHTRAIERALEGSVGVKPSVGFNWNNGILTQVSVTFPQVIDSKPLPVLAETVRAAVTTEFKQTPNNIVLGFALGKQAPGATAQLR